MINFPVAFSDAAADRVPVTTVFQSSPELKLLYSSNNLCLKTVKVHARRFCFKFLAGCFDKSFHNTKQNLRQIKHITHNYMLLVHTHFNWHKTKSDRDECQS